MTDRFDVLAAGAVTMDGRRCKERTLKRTVQDIQKAWRRSA